MKFILALSLLVCITFQVGKCDTVGQNLDQAIDWTEDTMSGAYNAMKNTASWVGEKVLPDSLEHSHEISDTISDAYADLKDGVSDAASDIAAAIY